MSRSSARAEAEEVATGEQQVQIVEAEEEVVAELGYASYLKHPSWGPRKPSRSVLAEPAEPAA
jgi:hypothetical protein